MAPPPLSSVIDLLKLLSVGLLWLQLKLSLLCFYYMQINIYTYKRWACQSLWQPAAAE